MKSLAKKIRSNKGESLAEAMAAMVLLAFAVLLFSALIIQSSRLMSRGAQNMAYYEAGQNALNARDMESDAIRTAEAKLNITGADGENAFSGLTPALRTGEGNEISVMLYRQELDWSRAGESKTASAETTSGSVLFTYDLANDASAAEESGSDADKIQSIGTEADTN